jgi:peptidoglycan hydrolase CwlO-like protein
MNKLSNLDKKVNLLSEKIGKLEADIAEKDKEIKGLSVKPTNVGKYCSMNRL